MIELWKAMKGYEDYYEVSNLGRTRSVPREVRAGRGPGLRKVQGYILKYSRSSAGYYYVKLCRNGAIERFYVHKLVLETFGPPRPEGTECAHLDGNKLNNNIHNLSWCTHRKNISMKNKHGTMLRGETHPCSKITEKDVYLIRSLRNSGKTSRAIAEFLGLNISTIYNVVYRTKWQHI